jgi:DNA-binding NarL/FixJ family response regulator
MRKVLLVDDEYYFRQALMASFPWKENGFTVCGEARDGEEALEKVIALSPDIALVDINMPSGWSRVRRDIREGNYPSNRDASGTASLPTRGRRSIWC